MESTDMQENVKSGLRELARDQEAISRILPSLHLLRHALDWKVRKGNGSDSSPHLGDFAARTFYV